MFYELQHSMRTDLIKTEMGVDFSFPLHLHDSFELITVTDGSMTVTVDKNRYVLNKGEALMIFPNQLHELVTEEHSSHFLCIFSSRLVKAYSKMCTSSVPKSNLFTPNQFFIEELMRTGDEADEDNVYLKGLLYSLCGEFHKNAEYIEQKSARDDLLAKIFRFVEENYSSDCSLSALAAATSYNYVYLSRYFRQCTNISFIEYVNRYRIDEACYLLKNSEQTVLKTALDCGFDSLRSFNRNFKSCMGVTPSEYRDN